jgi:hypothetical protein
MKAMPKEYSIDNLFLASRRHATPDPQLYSVWHGIIRTGPGWKKSRLEARDEICGSTWTAYLGRQMSMSRSGRRSVEMASKLEMPFSEKTREVHVGCCSIASHGIAGVRTTHHGLFAFS